MNNVANSYSSTSTPTCACLSVCLLLGFTHNGVLGRWEKLEIIGFGLAMGVTVNKWTRNSYFHSSRHE